MNKAINRRADRPRDPRPADSPEPELQRLNDAATALSSLYEQGFQELSAYLRKTYGDGPPDAEDVAQEAFRRLAEHSDLSSIGNLKAYLWRTARNLTLTEKRNSAIRSNYDFEIKNLYFALTGTESEPGRVLEAREQLEQISRAIREMPNRRRQAFLLHRLDNMNLAAVGRRLGITRSAVVKHVARAVIDIDAALAVTSESSDR